MAQNKHTMKQDNNTLPGFTKGKWSVSRYNDLQYSISVNGGGYEEQNIPDEEDKANASLIAAAPAMYEALCIVLDDFNTMGGKITQAAANKAQLILNSIK